MVFAGFAALLDGGVSNARLLRAASTSGVTMHRAMLGDVLYLFVFAWLWKNVPSGEVLCKLLVEWRS